MSSSANISAYLHFFTLTTFPWVLAKKDTHMKAEFQQNVPQEA